MKFFTKYKQQYEQKGFLLPSVIVLSVAISIIGITMLQITASTSSNLNAQYYNQIGNEAARAGLSYAVGCIKNGKTWSNLTPLTDCEGAATGGGSPNVAARDNWTSTFTVSAPVPNGMTTVITATGTVTLTGSSGPPYQVVLKKSLAAGQSIPISTGQSVTAIASGGSNCSIANGVLYCWGANDYGQLGTGDISPRTTPTPVARGAGQVFQNLRVTQVSTGTSHICAVASGDLYCWGRNADGELGVGYASAYETAPKLVGGALLGREVTKVSTSAGTSINHYTCAIADGRVFCWGENANQQLGQVTYYQLLGCRTNGLVPNKGASYLPIPIFGYNTGSNQCDGGAELVGKKATDIATGFAGACAIADGGMYCWGDLTQIILPEPPKRIASGSLNTGMLVSGPLRATGNTTCVYAVGSLHCNGFNMNKCGLLGCGDTSSNVFSGSVINSGTSNDISLLSCLVSNGTPMCAGLYANSTGHGGTGHTYNAITPTSAILGKVATDIGVYSIDMPSGACAVVNGSVACWGLNRSGEFGNGTSGNTSATAVATGGIGTAVGTAAANEVSVGTSHSCGIANGQTYCWGDNAYGQLGTGDMTARKVPTSPSTLTDQVATKVAAGDRHTCQLTNGKVFCWGDNTYGQLGTGSTGGTQVNPSPTAVAGPLSGKIVTDITAGGTSTCAIADSQAYCWGNNATKQIGNGATGGVYNMPQLVSALAGRHVRSISAGTAHTCAAANGDAYCWGANANGATGRSGVTTGNSDPTRVVFNSSTWPNVGNLNGPMITQVAAGNAFTCAIANGSSACWGAGGSGQLGNGTNTASQTTPVTVNGPDLVTGSLVDTITTGATHACAGGRGEAYCWGAGGSGQIGNNNLANRNTPARLSLGGLSDAAVTQVSAGGSTSCAVANGIISCWGAGTSGQIGDNNNASVRIPTTTSDYVLLAPTGVGLTY